MDINNIYNKTYLGKSVRYPLNNSVRDSIYYSLYNKVNVSVNDTVRHPIYNKIWDNTIQIINITL